MTSKSAVRTFPEVRYACVSGGKAEIQVGTKKVSIEKGSEIILLSETHMFIIGCSADILLEVFAFSKKMSFQAMRNFDPLFFMHINNHSVYKHIHPETYRNSLSYLSIISDLQNDPHNRFNVIIATNLLRSLMLTVYDKILKYDAIDKGDILRTRKEMIFDRLNFPDQSYMGRFFRRSTGVGPLAYRKQEITL